MSTLRNDLETAPTVADTTSISQYFVNSNGHCLMQPIEPQVVVEPT